MSVGRLKLSVFGTGEIKPVSNAKIQIFKKELPEKMLEELICNDMGESETIELATPPLTDSLGDSSEKPYAEYNIAIHREGFSDEFINGVQVFPDVTAIQEVEMNIVGNDNVSNIITIDEHTLCGNYPPKIYEEDVKPLPDPDNYVVLPEPVIPEYVIVHKGVPTAYAEDYRVSFADYIKNVASSEIYATWPYETIKANVLAISSIVLNRVYTEWYKSKGYSFTITNSTD